MKVIAIGGEPATGKSTLMIELIKSMNSIEYTMESIPMQILWRKDARRGTANDVCILGYYEPEPQMMSVFWGITNQVRHLAEQTECL